MGCSVYDSSLLGSGGGGGGGGDGGVVSGGGAAADSGGPSAMAGAVATGGTGGSGVAGLENTAGMSGDAGAAGMLGEGGATSPSKGGAGAGTAGTSGRSGAAGTGGSAGNAGLGGSSGRSGAGGGGTSGAGGSAAGAGGSGGSVLTANGCAFLSVPLTAAGNQARFDISLTSSTNFSAATISMRVYVKAGVGGVISNYVQDTAFNVLHNSTVTPLKTVSGWQTLTWNIGAQGPGSSGIALTGVSRIGIEINASPDTSWSNPTLVYVDSITVSSPALSFSFDTSGTVTSTSSFLDVAGQVLWLNSNKVDTSATGVTLGWLASCP